MGFKSCKNIFSKHKNRQGGFKVPSKPIQSAFHNHLGEGELLCESCRVICNAIIRKRKEIQKSGQFPPLVDDYVLEIRKNKLDKNLNRAFRPQCSQEEQSMEIDLWDIDSVEPCNNNILIEQQSEYCASQFSEEECESSDDESFEMVVDEQPGMCQKDDDFQLHGSEQKKDVLETVNVLLNKLQISVLNLSDIQNSQALVEKIDDLSSKLKSLFIKAHNEIEKPSEFESKLIEDIKKKFSEAVNYADKLTILTLLPDSWSARKIEKTIGCSYHAAQESKKLREKEGILANPVPRTRMRILTDVVIERIQKFYREIDISSPRPAAKDCKSVKNNNGKETIQQRLMLVNLREAYALFPEWYEKQYKEEITIGFSTFCQYRPEECILPDDSKGIHNVCVCVYHQNVKLLLDGLHALIIKLKLKEDIPTTYKEIFNIILCENPTEACRYDECFDCPGFNKVANQFLIFFKNSSITDIECKQWAIVDKKYQLITVKLTVQDYVEQLRKKFTADFRIHDYVAKSQNDFVRSAINNLKDNEILVMLDFSENYSCIIQNEIQAHHWNHQQVTIHPFCIYRKINGEAKPEHLVIISENLDHNVQAVTLFQEKLIAYLNEKKYNVSKIIYVSDGAAAQYKNRYNFLNLAHHFEKFSIIAEWHFFASCHGKSPCDGTGGTVKRLARRASIQNALIRTAKELYDWAIEALPNMNFVFCTNEEHSNIKNRLSKYFEKAKTIKGTTSSHAFIPLIKNGSVKITFKSVSHSSEFLIHNT